MNKQAKISVMLTAWNRPQYLEEQVAAVLNQSVAPHEVLLWYNRPSRKMGVVRPKPRLNFRNANRVKKIVCDFNFGIVPRFAMAPCLEGDYVCIFDDDTLPGRRWLENCLNHVDRETCLLGTIGLRFLSLQDGHVKTEQPRMGWEGCNERIAFVDVVGHSWFFRREWACHFWEDLPVSTTFGEDIHFCAMLQRHGIRVACPPHPAQDRSLWGSIRPERGVDKVAVSCSKDRSSEYHRVVAYEISKGFKPLML